MPVDSISSRRKEGSALVADGRGKHATLAIPPFVVNPLFLVTTDGIPTADVDTYQSRSSFHEYELLYSNSAATLFVSFVD